MVLTCSWPHISLEMNKLIFSNSKTLPKLTKMLCPFFSKIAVTYCEKMWIGLWLRKFFANLRLKAKAELLRSLEQFIRTVKCQNKFWSRMLFKLFARSDFGMQTGTSQKWCIVTKIVLTYCEKKLFQWSKIIFEIRDWRPRIFKRFEIIRTICSNSEKVRAIFGDRMLF